jgi:hypothetical protein
MKKNKKHMQFVRISLLIFALGFFFACSLGTQNYGKLSLSIEIPEYIKTEPNEQANNARFIHPDGDRLEFELYTKSRVIHTQSIALKSESESPSPQTVSITVGKVPYNVPLFAKITVFGEKTPTQGDEALLGSNDIYIGYLKSGNNKLTLGVKPVGNDLGTATYEDDEYDGIYLDATDYEFVWEIKMLSQKGLYTIVAQQNDLVLYASDGRQYKNTHSIKGQDGYYTLVFYHPENKASTYYLASSSGNEFSINYGTKLEQDILITKKVGSSIEILDGYVEYLGGGNNADEKKSLTIYNPYPFTLNLTNTIENADEYPDSQDKFTFEGFPDVLLPGKSEEFTVNFHDPDFDSTTYSVKSTISAPGLKDFVLHFTGTSSGT